jgi:hypothetical protein
MDKGDDADHEQRNQSDIDCFDAMLTRCVYQGSPQPEKSIRSQ